VPKSVIGQLRDIKQQLTGEAATALQNVIRQIKQETSVPNRRGDYLVVMNWDDNKPEDDNLKKARCVRKVGESVMWITNDGLTEVRKASQVDRWLSGERVNGLDGVAAIMALDQEGA